MTPDKALKPLNQTTVQHPDRVIQFGGGNFLRAFVDWMIDILNAETDFGGNVVIVKPTPSSNYEALRAQDGFYHVRLYGVKDGQLETNTRLITCVWQIVNPYREFGAYLDLAHLPEARFIISNTTEAGIAFDAGDQLAEQPPSSFPGKLTVLLHERFQHVGGDASKGFIILPCELIEDNGDELKRCVLQYIDHWSLSDEFKAWVESANTFCNTLVDRIVTGFPTENVDEILQEIGYDDRLLVEGESYHSWVIEAAEAVAAEFPVGQTDLNVKFVADLTPYRAMKVRFLNGAHTAMVPVGYLMGIETAREAIEHPVVGKFIEELLLEEVLPTLDLPDAELRQFAGDVLDRFRNPFMHHRLLSIALNSIAKFKARLLPTLIDYAERNGQPPRRIVFAFAALLRFYRGDNENGETIPLDDDPAHIDWLRELWVSSASMADLAATALSNPSVWGRDLTTIDGLQQQLSADLNVIDKQGVESALTRYV